MHDDDDEDDGERRPRTVTAIRRNGWDRSHAERAIGALTQLVAAMPQTPDVELAHELASWLAADPSPVLDLSVPEGLPEVPAHLASAVQILVDESVPIATRLSQLRQQYNDPTATLIAILDDMEPEDLDANGIHWVAAAAIHGLVQLGTVNGIRYLLAYYDEDLETLHRVLDSEVLKMEAIVPITLELWSSVDCFARSLMVESISHQRRHDDRIMKLLEEWIDSDVDAPHGVVAASQYNDTRLIPNVRAALERALSRDEYVAAHDAVAALEALGSEATESQRERIVAGLHALHTSGKWVPFQLLATPLQF